MNPKDLVGAKKAPLGLVPPALVIGASEAMGNGAAKYGPFNWRDQPVQYMTYLEAMQRHIAALIDGQDLAEDTGIHHLKHVVAGGGILLDAMAIPGGLIDNRPPKGPAADLLRALDKSDKPQTRQEKIMEASKYGLTCALPACSSEKPHGPHAVFDPDSDIGNCRWLVTGKHDNGCYLA
jgi:hypothetical protein